MNSDLKRIIDKMNRPTREEFKRRLLQKKQNQLTQGAEFTSDVSGFIPDREPPLTDPEGFLISNEGQPLRPPGLSASLSDLQTGSNVREAAISGLPALGALALSGGTSLPAQVIGASLGFGGGEAARQMFRDEPTDLERIVQGGVQEGGLTAAFGTAFKGLESAASYFKQFFPNANKPSDLARAKRFANENNLPKPLGGIASRLRNLGALTLSGGIASNNLVKQFTDEIDFNVQRTIQRLADTDAEGFLEKDITEAVTLAKKNLSDVLDSRQKLIEVQEKIGPDTVINLNPFYSKLDDFINEASDYGQTEFVAILKGMKEAFEKNNSVIQKTYNNADAQMFELFNASKNSPGLFDLRDKIKAAFFDSYKTTIQNNPEIALRLNQSPDDFIDSIQKAFQENQRINRTIRENKGLNTLIRANMEPRRFLTQWSKNAGAREILKKIDPELHNELNARWLGSNINEKLLKNEVLRESDVERWNKFLDKEKDIVTSMFGDRGVEAFSDLGNYLAFIKTYYKQDVSGETRALQALRGTGLSTLAGFGGGLPAAVLTETAGYALVKGIMSPNSPMNIIFNPNKFPRTRGELKKRGKDLRNLIEAFPQVPATSVNLMLNDQSESVQPSLEMNRNDN